MRLRSVKSRNIIRSQTACIEISSYLHQRLLKSFKEAATSLRHLGKPILVGNLYLGSLEIILRTLASGMTFRLPVITCPAEGYKKLDCF